MLSANSRVKPYHQRNYFHVLTKVQFKCLETSRKLYISLYGNVALRQGKVQCFEVARSGFSITIPVRELKQHRDWQHRRLRKHHLKREFALLQALSPLLRLVQLAKCWRTFLELNVFESSTKREIRPFHVVIVQ